MRKRKHKLGKVTKRKVAKRRARSALKHSVRVSGPRKRKISRKRKAKATRVLFGNPCAQTTIQAMGGTMPKKRSAKRVMPWFVRKGSKPRRRARRGGSFLGGAGGFGTKAIPELVKNGGLTVAGAAIGSMVGARVPLPAKLAGFRGLLPVVAGIALGASKFGRKGAGAYVALGMIVAGGLALGRQYVPQVFAGEDEMLGLPDLTEPLGLVYAGADDELEGDEEMEGDALGMVFQNGETPDDVELMGAPFLTGADQ